VAQQAEPEEPEIVARVYGSGKLDGRRIGARDLPWMAFAPALGLAIWLNRRPPVKGRLDGLIHRALKWRLHTSA
jgi:hypothetical protein